MLKNSDNQLMLLSTIVMTTTLRLKNQWIFRVF